VRDNGDIQASGGVVQFTARRLPRSVLSLTILHIELARSFKSKESKSKALLCVEPLALKEKMNSARVLAIKRFCKINFKVPSILNRQCARPL
jgi:hypothetical protein